jgi:hypothetical protein
VNLAFKCKHIMHERTELIEALNRNISHILMTCQSDLVVFSGLFFFHHKLLRKSVQFFLNFLFCHQPFLAILSGHFFIIDDWFPGFHNVGFA